MPLLICEVKYDISLYSVPFLKPPLSDRMLLDVKKTVKMSVSCSWCTYFLTSTHWTYIDHLSIKFFSSHSCGLSGCNKLNCFYFKISSTIPFFFWYSRLGIDFLKNESICIHQHILSDVILLPETIRLSHSLDYVHICIELFKQGNIHVCLYIILKGNVLSVLLSWFFFNLKIRLVISEAFLE